MDNQLNSAFSTVEKRDVVRTAFNRNVQLPFQLRVDDFELALRDIYDFFHDVNTALIGKGLQRMDDMLRPAMMSGLLSDMLTASLAKHSRVLTENKFFNGHPDLIVKGVYAGDAVQSGTDGVEVKTTRKRGGAVDMHGARDQWLCVFVYAVDNASEPARSRAPLEITEIYVAQVTKEDFRKNARGELGTRTATLHKQGMAKLRSNWVYLTSSGT